MTMKLPMTMKILHVCDKLKIEDGCQLNKLTRQLIYYINDFLDGLLEDIEQVKYSILFAPDIEFINNNENYYTLHISVDQGAFELLYGDFRKHLREDLQDFWS